MYEICRLLAAKKTPKPRKPSITRISIGADVKVLGRHAVVTRRDENYANAWFVAINGVEYDKSFSRDMLKVL